MKKIILSICLSTVLLVAQTAQAKSHEVLANEVVTAQYQMPFSNLIIEDDINVILVESSSKQFDIHGSAEDINNFNWTIKNGVMKLSTKKRNQGEKLTIKLFVKGLKELTVFGKSMISSLGSLSTPLNVHLLDEAYVAISNKSSINVYRNYEIDVNVQSSRGSVNIY